MSNITSAGNLTVSGNGIILGNTILGDTDKTLTVNSNSNFNGVAIFNNSLICDDLITENLTISGNIYYNNIINNGSLLQYGLSTFNSDAIFNNNITISGNISSNNITTNNLTVSDEIIVDGNAIFNNGITIDNITVDNITVNNNAIFNNEINVNSGITSSNNTFYIGSNNVFNPNAIISPSIINGCSSGTADGASYTDFNLAINSWYGVGFVYSNPAVSVCKCVIDTRSGNISTQGYINSGGLTNSTNPITNNAILNQNSTANFNSISNFNSSINTKGITNNSSSSIVNNGILTQNSTANFNANLNSTGITNNSSSSIVNNGILSQNGNANFNANSNFNGSNNTFYNNVLFLNPNQSLPLITSSNAGLGLYWNVYNSGGTGETTFLNYAQGGVGGFAFNNLNNSSTQKNLAIIDNNGNISLIGNIKYNYSTIPTLTSSMIGYKYSVSFNGTIPTGAIWFNSPITLPIGYYIVFGYCRATLQVLINYVLGLGISDSANTLTDYNYLQNNYYLNPSSQKQCLQYQYYLDVTTSKTFYCNFYCNNGATGTLDACNFQFIRIA